MNKLRRSLTAPRRGWHAVAARTRQRFAAAGVALTALALNASAAAAGTGGTSMPWNTPLQNILSNLTGPTARIVVGLAVVVAAASFLFKRGEEGAGKLGWTAVGGALFFGAQTMVTAFGFAGAIA